MKENNAIILKSPTDPFYKSMLIDNLISGLTLKPELLTELNSKEFYNVLLSGKDSDILNLFLAKHLDLVLEQCNRSHEIYDFFSFLILLMNPVCNLKCKEILKNKIFEQFDFKTISFMKRISILMEKENFTCNSICELILTELNKLNTVEASKVLIDLCHFADFKKFLAKNYPTVEFIIRKNLEAYPKAKGRYMVLGGSIIAKLVRSNHENIIDRWIEVLQNVNYSEDKSINMIGAASTCLVFKIGDYVLKIGETRVNRRIFINHRIIVSQHRKYHHDIDNNPLFYTEVMHYAKVGDVTIEERDELVEDLLKQGLIWSDSKLENCGVLLEGDLNIPNMEVDYEEVLGLVDEPALKLEFSQRKRKVVVIDNDIIDRDPRSLWKML